MYHEELYTEKDNQEHQRALLPIPGRQANILCVYTAAGQAYSSVLPPFIHQAASYIDGYAPYRGKYIIIACDGSGVNIHPDKEDMDTRVIHTKNPDDEKACNQVHLNALCTVPDGYFIDYEIQDFMAQDEIGACAVMMGRLVSMDLGGYIPLLCLDRGYESYYLMMLADSLGLRFCMRLKDIGSNGISKRYSECCDGNGCF